MSKSVNSKTDEIQRIMNMIAGLTKHMAGQTIVLGGVSITVADLIAILTKYLALLTAISTAETVWHTAVQTARTEETSQIDPLWANLTRYVSGMYGSTATMLADFGLKPRKPPKRSVANKSEAIAKNLATRELRNTMGPRQKEHIHGTVPEPTAPAEPAPQAVRPKKEDK